MDGILDALKGTPWWVYIIFIYLAYIGIRALKPHVMSVRKIYILPLVFLALSIYGLIAAYQEFGDVMLWLFMVVIGCSAGWALTKKVRIKADKKKLLIGLPGNPLILVLILTVFAIKYFFGYYSATHPLAQEDTFFHSASIIASALISGVFLGRLFFLLKKFYHAEHTKLKEK